MSISIGAIAVIVIAIVDGEPATTIAESPSFFADFRFGGVNVYHGLVFNAERRVAIVGKWVGRERKMTQGTSWVRP